jgi:peptidoglycan hydrolase-like protein with peptidoglycan-binding domain
MLNISLSSQGQKTMTLTSTKGTPTMNSNPKHATGLVSLALCTSLGALTPLHPAQAGSTGGAFVGGLVGGAIGSAIVNEHYRSKETHSHPTYYKRTYQAPAPKAPAVSSEGIKVQKALASLGVYSGPLDGNLDSYATRSAIMAYQQQHGLPQTGMLLPEVKSILSYHSELAELSGYVGYSGYDPRDRARRLQASLKVLGFYSGTIDGSLGGGSRTAISQYQQSNGLPASGALLAEQEDELASSAASRLQQQQMQVDQQLQQIASRGQPQQAPVAQRGAQPQYQPAYSQAPQPMQQPAPIPVSNPPAASPVAPSSAAPQYPSQPAGIPAQGLPKPQYVGVSNQ